MCYLVCSDVENVLCLKLETFTYIKHLKKGI